MAGFGTLSCGRAMDFRKKLGTTGAALLLIQMRSWRPRKEKLLAQGHMFA